MKRDLESLRKQWFSFVFSPARRLLPLPSASSIINFDWVNLVFAAPQVLYLEVVKQVCYMHTEYSFPVVNASVGVPDRI